MKLNYGNSQVGITRAEVIVIIAVLTLLGILVSSEYPQARERARRSHCINFLMQIGLSTRQWAIDNKHAFPAGLSTNVGGIKEYTEVGQAFRYFQLMSNQLNTPFILACPSDIRRPAKNFATLRNTNISYFVGLDADEIYPNMFLAGDRNLTNGSLSSNGIIELKSTSAVGWTGKIHKFQGNVGLADGSVIGISTRKLQETILNSGDTVTRLAFPLD